MKEIKEDEKIQSESAGQEVPKTVNQQDRKSQKPKMNH